MRWWRERKTVASHLINFLLFFLLSLLHFKLLLPLNRSSRPPIDPQTKKRDHPHDASHILHPISSVKPPSFCWEETNNLIHPPPPSNLSFTSSKQLNDASWIYSLFTYWFVLFCVFRLSSTFADDRHHQAHPATTTTTIRWHSRILIFW